MAKKSKELMGTEEALNAIAEALLATAEACGVTLACMEVEEIEEVEDEDADEEEESDELSTEEFINAMDEEDELKEVAKALKIKGYAKMNVKALKKAILAIDEDDITTVLAELGYTGADEEEVDEDDSDEEMSAEDIQASLEEADLEDLQEICKANKLKAGKTKKTAIKAIMDALEAEEITQADIFGEDEEEADEDDAEDDDDAEEEGEESLTPEELAEFLNDCTKAEVSKVAKALKVKEGVNQKATVKAIVAKDADKVYKVLVDLELVEEA